MTGLEQLSSGKIITFSYRAVGPDGAWNGLNTPCPAPCTAATLSGRIVVTVSGGKSEVLSGRNTPTSEGFTCTKNYMNE